MDHGYQITKQTIELYFHEKDINQISQYLTFADCIGENSAHVKGGGMTNLKTHPNKHPKAETQKRPIKY